MDKKPEIIINSVEPCVAGGFVVSWSSPLWGFGEMTFYFDEHERLCLDTEYMGTAFAKALLTALIDTLNEKERIR